MSETENMRICARYLAVVILLPTVFGVRGLTNDEFRVANLFSDGAVLQRDSAIQVWGTASQGTSVTVSFSGQTKIATTGEAGRWQLQLDPLPASAEGKTMTVNCGVDETTIQINDLLVGEVWLCAGQSNMAMRVELARDADKEIASSNLPQIRVHTVSYHPAREPLNESLGKWEKASPETSGNFSATAFFFGRELYHKLDVPIGLIVAARGGSDITAWTSREVQEAEPKLEPLLQSWLDKVKAYTPAVATAEKARYETEYPKWLQSVKEAANSGQPRPKKPVGARKPIHPADHHHHPATLFNGMINPIIPYSIRGAIWYQGETNAFTEADSTLYETQLPLLINDWRKRWGQGEFPFAWVQLPFTSARQVAWARIRESMRRTLELPNTGMAVTLDLGEENLLHPLNKQAFAHRLALWARADVYGETITASGPQYRSMRVGEKGVVLRFDHADGICAAGTDNLVGFEYLLEGESEWKPAVPRIQSDRLIIMNPAGQKITAVRYAWGNHPKHNLINSAGLPASPFITSNGKNQKRPRKPAPADLNHTPLVPASLSEFPKGTNQLDIYLLMGQSNMKGRGVMPATPHHDPQILMMHRMTDEFFIARHPLHLVGDPITFAKADNAGVGPGLAFAKSMKKSRPDARVLLIPCAVGGTAISKWQKGARLYEETVRRAKLALKQAPEGKARIAGALWLQGESDSNTPERIAIYSERLDQMISDLRSDLAIEKLPFIACTIGELKEASVKERKAINGILLDLPNRVPHTACVDSRAFAGDIGDQVHFDTETQEQHGIRFAKKFLKIAIKSE